MRALGGVAAFADEVATAPDSVVAFSARFATTLALTALPEDGRVLVTYIGDPLCRQVEEATRRPAVS